MRNVSLSRMHHRGVGTGTGVGIIGKRGTHRDDLHDRGGRICHAGVNHLLALAGIERTYGVIRQLPIINISVEGAERHGLAVCQGRRIVLDFNLAVGGTHFTAGQHEC